MEKLTKDVAWAATESDVSKKDRKDALADIGNAMLQKQIDDKDGTATPRWAERWAVQPGAMAPYFARQCPMCSREGRRFKTMLRASAWRPDEGESRKKCPRCSAGPNSAEHLIFGCCAVGDEPRQQFLSAMRKRIASFGNISDVDKLDLLLAADAPKEWDRTLYKYLGCVHKSITYWCHFECPFLLAIVHAPNPFVFAECAEPSTSMSFLITLIPTLS